MDDRRVIIESLLLGCTEVFFITTDRVRVKGGGRRVEGVGVMKVKELNLEETEVSHPLGGPIKYT